MQRRNFIGGVAGVAAAASITKAVAETAPASADMLRIRMSGPQMVIADSQGRTVTDISNGKLRFVSPERGFVHGFPEVRVLERG